MSSIFIFAGTTEGRELSEILSDSGFDCTVSVATEYGAKLLPHSENIMVMQGRLNHQEMCAAFSRKNYDCVIDATHPFAVEVSKEIKIACEISKIKYFRLARNTDANLNQDNAGLFYFDDVLSASQWLESQSEKIFITTGSKELPKICGKITDKSRLFVRVLPSEESLRICDECQIARNQVIAMQGPFSKETNNCQFLKSGAKILLTKESGTNGGYFEKIEAAKSLGMKIAVIRNPEKSSGTASVFHSVQEICAILLNK